MTLALYCTLHSNTQFHNGQLEEGAGAVGARHPGGHLLGLSGTSNFAPAKQLLPLQCCTFIKAPAVLYLQYANCSAVPAVRHLQCCTCSTPTAVLHLQYATCSAAPDTASLLGREKTPEAAAGAGRAGVRCDPDHLQHGHLQVINRPSVAGAVLHTAS